MSKNILIVMALSLFIIFSIQIISGENKLRLAMNSVNPVNMNTDIKTDYQESLTSKRLNISEENEEEIKPSWYIPENALENKNKIRTIVNDKATKEKLIGNHGFSLQWISWEQFGKVRVDDLDGTLFLYGKQEKENGPDYLMINGIITEVNKLEFTFNGTIINMVSHNNNGKPCVRSGVFTFLIKDKRPFWRMQQMLNPCDGVVTDYVDISR